MPSNNGGEPWWQVFADQRARKQAYEIAATINQRPGGIQNLSLQQAEEVANGAKDGANIEYLEALTVPAAGSDAPPPNRGPLQPDTPEVAANLERTHAQRKRAMVVAIVAADMASRESATGSSSAESSLHSLPTPINTSAAIEATNPTPSQAPGQEAASAMDEGETTPTQESFGRRARADSVKFIRERTNSRSASTTPTRATAFQTAIALPHLSTEPIATSTGTESGQVTGITPISQPLITPTEPTEAELGQATGILPTSTPSTTTTTEAELGQAIGILPTSQPSEQIESVEEPAPEPPSPRAGPSREEKGKWVVREPPTSDMSSGSLTPRPSGSEASLGRNALYRQARMTTSRLALYEKSQATLALTPTSTTPAAASAHTMAAQGQPGPSQRRPNRRAGVLGLQWAYATHTRADKDLQDLGLLLWEKLPTCYQPEPAYAVDNVEDWLRAPIIVSNKVIMHNAPAVHLENDLTHVLTFARTRPDARSHAGHPDFLGGPPGYKNMKLCEYQSCEFFGQEIWRHDRELHTCRLEGCKVKISDWNADSFLCLGCGPKTIVRYCCKAHMLDDNTHWEECGSPDLLIKRVIDHNTEPPRFWRHCAAIVDRYGYTSPERHRQRNHAMLSSGQYTLFLDDTIDATTGQSTPQEPKAITYPATHPSHTELSARIERLLNLAFFDHTNLTVLSYLYRLLRSALQASRAWNEDIEEQLGAQLMLEFGITSDITADTRPLCACEWSPATTTTHTAGCPSSHKFPSRAGELMPTAPTSGGLESHVKDMESKYWILRAWRQQHEVQYWRRRVSGEGFSGVTLPTIWPHPFMGEGCKLSFLALLFPH